MIPSSDSELSSAPDDEVIAREANGSNATDTLNGTGKKRKAEAVTKTTKRTKTTAVKVETAKGDADTKLPKRAVKTKVAEERAEEAVVKDEAEAEEAPKKQRRARKVKVEEKDGDEVAVAEGENGQKAVKAKATRQKKVKVEDLPPLAPRTVGSKLLVGAHVSIAGGKIFFPELH